MPSTLHTDDRPPVVVGAAPTLGTAALRPTVAQRGLVRPRLGAAVDGFELHDPAAIRFWSAVVGPQAVGDLLRLVVAARRRLSVPRPLHLTALAREGLVTGIGPVLWVSPRVPRLMAHQLRRLSPGLRREYEALGIGRARV